MSDYSQYIEFATDREREYIAAIGKHGTQRKAAAKLGVGSSTISRAMSALRLRAARKGHSPDHDMVHTVPDGYGIRGVSTLYGPDGEVKQQWVKSEVDRDRMHEIMQFAASVMAESVTGLAPITKPPRRSEKDLLCVYPMGDPHFGMYAWAQDAGDDFDLEIAERLTCGAIDRLIASAPASHTAVLLNLGDMFHADNQKNQTQSGHQLDVDGRWGKVLRVGLEAMLYCIRRLLEKHPKVIFKINRGNHDGHSSQALALMVSCYFSNEPRVEVDLSPADFWYYRFGNVMIGSTHGDKAKSAELVSIMAHDMPEDWGGTKHRYWYVGHIHHQDTKEYRGGVVEHFRTLAARDAWHAGQGYRAGRDMRCIVHHKEYGEIERHRCDVAMIDKPVHTADAA